MKLLEERLSIDWGIYKDRYKTKELCANNLDELDLVVKSFKEECKKILNNVIKENVQYRLKEIINIFGIEVVAENLNELK